MKNKEIKYLEDHEVVTLSLSLFEFIRMTYDIKEAKEEFPGYFANFLKSHFKMLTFNDLHEAFEINSLGRIDTYLPTIAGRHDNKVKSFNIPDLTKIINAFSRFKGLEKKETADKKVFSPEEKTKINNEWCDFIALAFEKYRDEFEQTTISATLITVLIFSDLKLVDKRDIDYSERVINVKLGYFEKSRNEILIYKTFNKLIRNGEHIEDYLKNKRGEYSSEMPW